MEGDVGSVLAGKGGIDGCILVRGGAVWLQHKEIVRLV